VLPFAMDPLVMALISAGATAIGIAIPIAWAFRVEKESRALRAERQHALNEAARWRGLYYDLLTGGVDVESRRTVLYRGPRMH